MGERGPRAESTECGKGGPSDREERTRTDTNVVRPSARPRPCLLVFVYTVLKAEAAEAAAHDGDATPLRCATDTR